MPGPDHLRILRHPSRPGQSAPVLPARPLCAGGGRVRLLHVQRGRIWRRADRLEDDEQDQCRNQEQCAVNEKGAFDEPAPGRLVIRRQALVISSRRRSLGRPRSRPPPRARPRAIVHFLVRVFVVIERVGRLTPIELIPSLGPLGPFRPLMMPLARGTVPPAPLSLHPAHQRVAAPDAEVQFRKLIPDHARDHAKGGRDRL